jgi:hypothetical protein
MQRASLFNRDWLKLFSMERDTPESPGWQVRQLPTVRMALCSFTLKGLR